MYNNNSTTITINFDQSDSFFTAGKTISGTVSLHVHEQEIKFREIFMTLQGKISYTTANIVYRGKCAGHPMADHHHIPFLSTTIFFVQSQSEKKEFTFIRGQYSRRFQIHLPDYLPPTINNAFDHSYVRYYLKLVVVKPWYHQNVKHIQYLTVFPRVNILQNPLSTNFCAYNRQNIKLQVVLNKLGYVPGEIIVVKIEIKNPQRVCIKHINLSMIGCIRIAVNTRRCSVFKTLLPKIINSTDEQIEELFYLLIPAEPLPPSSRYICSIKRPICIEVQYYLKFQVKVKGLFTNFDLTIPINLGTEPIPDANQQQALDLSGHFISFIPERDISEDDSILI
jgi:hypothetical protein